MKTSANCALRRLRSFDDQAGTLMPILSLAPILLPSFRIFMPTWATVKKFLM